MKYVIDHGRVTKMFKDIQVGEFFLLSINVYLKISSPRILTDDDDLHSALNIDTFELGSIPPHQDVYPLTQATLLLLSR